MHSLCMQCSLKFKKMFVWNHFGHQLPVHVFAKLTNERYITLDCHIKEEKNNQPNTVIIC